VVLQTRIIELTKANQQEMALLAADYIRKGKIILIPTDTLYGIVADYFNSKTRELIFSIKQRSTTKPFIVLTSTPEQLQKMCISTISERILKLLPAPLTLVVNNKHQSLYNEKTIALRCPDNWWVREVIRKAQTPIVAPSANIADEPVIIDYKELIRTFDNKLDCIIYQKQPLLPIPSTIWDLTTKPHKVLREGQYKEPIPEAD
jgi:L-threonylcarbamoyladenylate synthase